MNMLVSNVLFDWNEMQFGTCEFGMPSTANPTFEEFDLIGDMGGFVSQ